jgi:hypothetical protein
MRVQRARASASPLHAPLTRGLLCDSRKVSQASGVGQKCPPAETGGLGTINRLSESRRPSMGRTKWKAGGDGRRSDCRIAAFDRSVTRKSNLRAESTYSS